MASAEHVVAKDCGVPAEVLHRMSRLATLQIDVEDLPFAAVYH